MDFKKLIEDSFKLSHEAFTEYLDTESCLHVALKTDKTGFKYAMDMEFLKAFVGAVIFNYHTALVDSLKQKGIDIEGIT
jgi:hypothetical protein